MSIEREIKSRLFGTVQPGQTAYVQLEACDGEMVLHVEVTADGGPRIMLREGRKTIMLFERR